MKIRAKAVNRQGHKFVLIDVEEIKRFPRDKGVRDEVASRLNFVNASMTLEVLRRFNDVDLDDPDAVTGFTYFQCDKDGVVLAEVVGSTVEILEGLCFLTC